MRSLVSLVAVTLLCGAWPVESARAFSIASGFGEGCHERITALAFQDHLLDLPFYQLIPPEDESWRDLSAWVTEQFGEGDGQLSDAHAFIMVSLLVGVRAPDTDGHSVTDFAALRRLHADPRDEGQYAHALRGIGDDGPEGDLIAVEGTRQIIREKMLEAIESAGADDNVEQFVQAPMYFDFYGRSTVTVWRPMYALGQAAHALQDSFAHTLRDDRHELRRIVHVFNYVEAITTDFEAERDGMRHSDSTDDCRQSSELADAAVLATIDLFLAAREMASGREPDAIEYVLDRWLTVEPGCTALDDFCGNTRWIELAQREPTRPYLDSILGCRAGAAPVRIRWPAAAFVLMLGVLRRRSRRERRR